MNTTERSLLESKFKRHRIKYNITNNSITIGQAQIDYVSLFGLAILPNSIALILLLYIIFDDYAFVDRIPFKIIFIIIGLFAVGISQAYRLLTNQKINGSIKTLSNGVLKIDHKDFKGTFDKRNTQKIGYTLDYFEEEEIFQGSLFLLDNEDIMHPLLGFYDEEERYMHNDLQWYLVFFEKQLRLNH
ncbi:hypothetical protein [Aquimarina rhabdastrellae]